MLSAEIIAIGSEMLTPERTDTNSLWLTARLNDVGIEVKLKTIVGDDEARLEEAIKDALKRAEVVITTGGLGSTEDDVTRQVSARAVGRKLIYHEELEAGLRERFKHWGREMPEINKRQAFVIEGASILENPNGSASGMFVELDGKALCIFPGPPREMRPMFENFVLPKLSGMTGGLVVRRRLLRVTGMGESAVDEKIAEMYKAYADIETSILFTRVEIEIHLRAISDDPEAAEARLDELSKKIKDALGSAVFATDGETMEEVIGEMLRKRGETLAVAESCTGGLIGMRLTEVPGSSAYFLEGTVTYSNDAKVRALGVSEKTLENFGAVSDETAIEMAEGMLRISGATHAISVTGIAGPDGGSEEKPVGTVYFGYAGASGSFSKRFVFPGDRELIRWRSSQAALELLRRKLIDNGTWTMDKG